LVWLAFLVCLGIILLAGTKLARYGDIIAEKTGLGGIWVGMVLLAAITSVPEMATGIGSAALVGSADLATGTLFGSNLFNLAILALLDVSYPVTPLLTIVSSRHSLLVIGIIVLTAIAGVSIIVGEAFSGFSIGWLGVPGIIILITYVFFIRRMTKVENDSPAEETEDKQYDSESIKTVWFKFCLAALAVIGAGIWISFIGDEIAQVTGWGTSFVGSLFLAIGTSAPELVVTFAAIRIGSTDMAMADILGSNMFNIAIIFFIDIFYTEGPVLSGVSNVHLITVLTGILMAIIVIIGLRVRQRKKVFKFASWYSPPLLILYLLGFYFLFLQV